ncbi:glycoside hydrolase family 16 protein [Mucilaginibacter sabulilitoris]|uniref:Glycoside hydrolase family 16 protein n=1 Tax=Mucilaginibacter sabulilitoris TaxID=1173583 RepID=A0ABZ0TRE2_9SPHI|nr:glycoside hydrolase family 16 protein [Mucilaginibacter sabulilitoris]WPU95700.1 glycoside hydrolase family 16 protein [Mucilaginibacter sabulilitoris]
MTTSTYLTRMLVAGLGCLILSSCSKIGLAPVPNESVPLSPGQVHVIPNYDVNDTALTNKGWIKSFEDNFNGDLSQWRVLNGGVQKELACYQAANLKISGGYLTISAKKETVTGPEIVGADPVKSFDYSSGWIVSKAQISINATTPVIRIVARLKVAPGNGLTSLLYSFGGNWPTNGEIDFLEVKGSDKDELLSDYQYGQVPLQDLVKNGLSTTVTDGDLSAAFHVYEFEWSQTSIRTYIDGKLVETKTQGGYIPAMFGKMQSLSLSLPVGGLYYNNLQPANVVPGAMVVDYVKIFSSSKPL